MKILNTEEILQVSGGLAMAEGGGGGSSSHWYDGIVSWFHNSFGGSGGGGGLTQQQAMQGCQDLGRGLDTVLSGQVGRMYPGKDVKEMCQNAVQNTINYEDAGPSGVCTQVDGGKWDSLSRKCIL